MNCRMLLAEEPDSLGLTLDGLFQSRFRLPFSFLNKSISLCPRRKKYVRSVIAGSLLLVLSTPAFHAGESRGSKGHHTSYTHPKSGTSIKSKRPSRRATGVQRDSHGRIKRDPKARQAFMRTHPCPSTGKTKGACPGYVVDHIKPLKRGGADTPSNMQWQTQAAAKAKDKWE